MAQYIYIKGKKTNHYRWSKNTVTDQEVEMVFIGYNGKLKYCEVGKDSCFGYGCPAIINGKFTLEGEYVLVEESRECTMAEEVQLRTEMARHNMAWSKHSYTNKLGYQIEDEALRWKDKNLFKIIVNGKEMTYEEFGKFKFEDDDLVILHSDNGYSHCWSDTFKTDCIYDLLKRMFEESTERVNFDEYYKVRIGNQSNGWDFNNEGSLVIRTRKTENHYSEVSNS